MVENGLDMNILNKNPDPEEKRLLQLYYWGLSLHLGKSITFAFLEHKLSDFGPNAHKSIVNLGVQCQSVEVILMSMAKI